MVDIEVYDSANLRHPVLEEFAALIKYRDLIPQLVARGIKTRYKRSIIGIGWTMLNPLLMMLVLTLVFSNLFRFYLEYFPAYLLIALVLWNFFAQSTTSAMGEMIYGGSLFSRIYVPKSVYAVSSIGIGLVNLAFSLGPLLIIMALLKMPIRLTALFIPIPVFLTAVFAMGIGLLLSTGVVYFADMMPIYEVLLTAWLYLTPIIYPLDVIPENLVWLIKINPMYYLVESFRLPLYAGVLPGMDLLLMDVAIASSALLLGWWLFSSKSREYAYRI